MNATLWPTSAEGCIYEGSCSRTADELNRDTIALAKSEGFPVTEGWDSDTEVTCDGRWITDADQAQYVSDLAVGAVDYLNTHCAPEGYCFMFDDGLYLYAVNEDGEPTFD